MQTGGDSLRERSESAIRVRFVTLGDPFVNCFGERFRPESGNMRSLRVRMIGAKNMAETWAAIAAGCAG